MITRLDIRKKIGEIAGEMDDPETAHSLEDELYQLVLETIVSKNTDDVLGLCLEALKTKQMDFPRWCS
jgi:hypothetical protein